MGQGFVPAAGQPGGAPALLMSETLWRQSFHADPGIVGRPVKVSGKTYSVAGVMPKSFRFPDRTGPEIDRAVWIALQPTKEMLTGRGYHFLEVVGKMKPGVTAAQVQREVDSIASHLALNKDSEALQFHVVSYQELLTGPVKPVLYSLFAALGLVLLIACANVSNLLIARCLGRQQEFAVRAALGAGRVRLVLQMLAEGLVLSVLGCCVGVVFAELAMVLVGKLPGRDDPQGGGDLDPLDHRAGAGGDCGSDHRAFVTAACSAGGAG